MKAAVHALMSSLICVACASYQPKGLSGGYSDTHLWGNTFHVTFAGNAHITQEHAADFALLRAAELTLENDFSYFAILDSATWTSTSVNTSHSSSTTNMSAHYGSAKMQQHGGKTSTSVMPHAELDVELFSAKPQGYELVYEATIVRKSIRAKYEMDE